MLRPNFNQQIMLAVDREDAEIKRKKKKTNCPEGEERRDQTQIRLYHFCIGSSHYHSEIKLTETNVFPFKINVDSIAFSVDKLS